MLSWERQRELYNHLAYLREKERADNFSWDDWRKRVRLYYYLPYFCFTPYFSVPQIHKSQEIQIDRSVQENGQGQQRAYTQR